MKVMLVLMVLVVLLSTVLGMPQYFGKKRKFPGQRLRGATNYGTHSFGKNGYDDEPIARTEKKLRRFQRRRLHLSGNTFQCSPDGALCLPVP